MTMRPLAFALVATSLFACVEPEDDFGRSEQALSASDVVINELTAGSSGKVELYNLGIATLDLGGWTVDDIASGGAAPKLLAAGTTLAPGAWLIVSYAGINTSSADQVRLLDASGVEVDAHDNFYAGTSISGLCFGRRPDGGAWATSSIACSVGATNGGATPPPPPPPPVTGLTINEYTAGTAGWIELHNASTTAASIGGWSVDDEVGGKAPKQLASGTTIPAGGRLVVTFSGINASSADQVRLLDAAGAVVDSHPSDYRSSSIVGLCFGRQPDGGAWATTSIPCSSGASNAPACPVGAACDDGNTCTTGEVWSASCACGGGAPVTCDDGDACTADACGPTGCEHSPVADDTACGVGLTCQAGACAPVTCDPPAGTPAEIVASGAGATLLRGTVVRPNEFFDGEVLVVGDTIVCVAPSCANVQAAAGATVIETHGIILPGLIDTHNHILFNTFDETDWAPTRSYTNHNQWPNDARYGAMVDAKQYLNGESGSTVNLNCELEKYGELKALVSGTTSVVGAANPANKACYASVARTIDQSPNDLDHDAVQVATLFPSTTTADAVCENFTTSTTDAYLIHVAEGVDETARAEFDRLGTITTSDACLYAPMTTIVHGTALGAPEMTRMAEDGMSLVWSPRSNVFLYGAGTDVTMTTDIPLALANGLTVALAPDWSLGGSVNLLDELRFADHVDATRWGDVLTPQQLFQMVTINAARVLALEPTLGSLDVGKKADLFVIGGNPTAPYDALLAASARDVRLVMVGGVPLYGDLALRPVNTTNLSCEALDVCCAGKFVCVAEAGGTATNKLSQTYADITAAIASGLSAYDALDLSAWDFAPMAPLFTCPGPAAAAP